MISLNKGIIVTEVESIIKYINEIKHIPVLTKFVKELRVAMKNPSQN